MNNPSKDVLYGTYSLHNHFIRVNVPKEVIYVCKDNEEDKITFHSLEYSSQINACCFSSNIEGELFKINAREDVPSSFIYNEKKYIYATVNYTTYIGTEFLLQQTKDTVNVEFQNNFAVTFVCDPRNLLS